MTWSNQRSDCWSLNRHPTSYPHWWVMGRASALNIWQNTNSKYRRAQRLGKKITDKKNSEDEAHYRCKSFIFNIFYVFNFSFTPSSCLVLKTDLHIHGAIRCLLTFKSHVSQLLDMALTFINLEIFTHGSATMVPNHLQYREHLMDLMV